MSVVGVYPCDILPPVFLGILLHFITGGCILSWTHIIKKKKNLPMPSCRRLPLMKYILFSNIYIIVQLSRATAGGKTPVNIYIFLRTHHEFYQEHLLSTAAPECLHSSSQIKFSSFSLPPPLFVSFWSMYRLQNKQKHDFPLSFQKAKLFCNVLIKLVHLAFSTSFCVV